MTATPIELPFWMQALNALGPTIAAFIAVGVAFWQGWLQRRQLKQNLYAKRLDVYLSLRLFLNNYTTTSAITFLQRVNEAQFLFKPDVDEFLTQVYKKAQHCRSFKEQEEHAQRIGQPVPLNSSYAEDQSWLVSTAPKLAAQKFDPYLKLF